MSTPASLQSALQQIQRQQQESLHGLDALQRQHREWQQGVAELLAVVSKFETDGSKHDTHDTYYTASDYASPNKQTQHSQLRMSTESQLSGAGQKDANANSRPSRPSEGQGTEDPQQNNPPKLQLQKTASAGRLRTLRETTMARLPILLAEVLRDEEASSKDYYELTRWQRMQIILASIVDSLAFEYLTGFIILANMVVIGAEAEMALLGRDTTWATEIERSFLAIYTFELVLRICAGGFGIFKSAWSYLDLFLVVVGIIALVVAPSLESSTGDEWERVLIVRGLRLLRLARVLRTLRRLQIVWRLVSGLLSAWDTMASTMGLILLWLYIFGCVATEIITNDPQLRANTETAAIIDTNFGSVPRATLTLLQFVTMDAIAEVYFPLVVEKPILIIYFLPLLMFLSIGLMNLVTAVLVDHALRQSSLEAEAEREKKKKEIKAALPGLLDVFDSLDADQSGTITREEIAGVPITLLPPKILETTSVNSMEDMFDMLDGNETGSLSQVDFLDGLLSLLVHEMPIWALQLQKRLLPLQKATNQISNDLQFIKWHHESF